MKWDELRRMKFSDEEIRDWLAHLRTGRKLSGSSLNVAVNAVRAFQEWVLHRPREECVRGVPKCKRDVTRAEVYAQCELAAILRAAEPGRDQTLLTLIYACGLRRDEARMLQIGDIDGPRESLHVRRLSGSTSCARTGAASASASPAMIRPGCSSRRARPSRCPRASRCTCTTAPCARPGSSARAGCMY